MLLLHRRKHESVVLHPDGKNDEPVVVRVCEVLPTGDVTLGFMGDGYTILRHELFNQNRNERCNKDASKYSNYYS